MKVTEQMLSKSEANLTAAQEEVDRLKAIMMQTRRKQANTVEQVNQLREELTALAAQLVLDRVEAATVDEHIAEIQKLKQQVTVFKLALTGLEPIYQAAIDTRGTASTTLSKQQNWKRFWELKAQLLEKYDKEFLHQAKLTANNIGFHGSAIGLYRDFEN